MSQGLSYTFGWVLLHFLWQGTAIALALGVVLALSRRATPEFRYRLACAGMALMVGAPLVTGWALEVPARAEAANAAPFEPGPALGGLSEAPVFTPSPVARAVVKAVRPGVRGGLDRIAPWLLLPWFLGVLALATRLAGGAGWLYQARKRSRALEGLWLERLEVLRQHLAIPRKVALRVLDELDGPMVVGWLHP